MQTLCDMGFSAIDIITTLFRIVRNYDMQEFLKLEFIRVGLLNPLILTPGSLKRPSDIQSLLKSLTF